MNNELDKIKKFAFLASFDVDQSWSYLERQKGHENLRIIGFRAWTQDQRSRAANYVTRETKDERQGNKNTSDDDGYRNRAYLSNTGSRTLTNTRTEIFLSLQIPIKIEILSDVHKRDTKTHGDRHTAADTVKESSVLAKRQVSAACSSKLSADRARHTIGSSHVAGSKFPMLISLTLWWRSFQV